MNKYTITKIDGSEEMIEAVNYEWDKISSNRAVIFYNFNERKLKEPCGYFSQVQYIKDEVGQILNPGN